MREKDDFIYRKELLTELRIMSLELNRINMFFAWFKRFVTYASIGGFITTAVYITAKIMRLF
jgi:hypothetical protein